MVETLDQSLKPDYFLVKLFSHNNFRLSIFPLNTFRSPWASSTLYIYKSVLNFYFADYTIFNILS